MIFQGMSNRMPKKLYKRCEYSAQQYHIFHHKQYHEVIDLVYSNIRYAFSVAFYENLTENCLRNILAIVFHNKDINVPQHQKRNIAKMITILKSNLLLLDYIDQNRKFNKKLIFGFLFCDPVPEVGVNIFSEVFLIYAKYAPSQVLKIFKDQEIQEMLLGSLKFGPIHKVIYTAIFCLDQSSTLQHPKFVPKCLYALIHIIFKDDNGKSIFGEYDEYYEKYLIKMEQLSENTVQEISTPRVKAKQLFQEKQLKKKSSAKSENQKQSHVEKNKRNYSFFKNINSKHETFQEKKNPYFLTKVAEKVTHVTQMMEQVFRNVSQIYQGNILSLLNVIQEKNYIEKLFMYMRIIRESDYDALEKNQCFYEFFRLFNMILLGWQISEETIQEDMHKLHRNQSCNENFKDIRSSIDSIKSLNSIQKMVSQQDQQKNWQKNTLLLPQLPEDVYLYRNIDKIYDTGQMNEEEFESYSKTRKEQNHQIHLRLIEVSLVIIEQFNYFQLYEGQQEDKNKKLNLKQSMNSDIERVTLSQYQQLKLTLTILEFLEVNSYMKVSQQFSQKIKELKEFNEKRIISKIQKLLKISKWNNIIHVKIVQLTRKYLFLFYHEFFTKIMQVRDISMNFLGLLVEMFRNSVFMFLESGKRSNYGDRHVLYTLSKLITNQFLIHGDLSKVYEKFPLWKEFVHQDLDKYHNQHIFQLCPNEENYKFLNLWRHKSLELNEEHFQINIGNGDEAEELAKNYDQNRRQKRASVDEKMLLFGEKKILDQSGEGFEMKNTKRIVDEMPEKNSLRDFSLYYRALKQSCKGNI